MGKKPDNTSDTWGKGKPTDSSRESRGSEVRCAAPGCSREPHRQCMQCEAHLCETHGNMNYDPYGAHEPSKHWEHLEVQI